MLTLCTGLGITEENAMKPNTTRRTFLKTAGVLAGAAVVGSTESRAQTVVADRAGTAKQPFTLRFGLASYTTRKLTLEQTIAAARLCH
jgi:hypothetical protein